MQGLSRSTRWVEARCRAGIEVAVVLAGASMTPALHAGDRARVARLQRLPRPGELVLARRGAQLVLHRVVEIAGDRVITRGDASPQNDSPIDVNDVLGAVTQIRRTPRWRRMLGRLRRAWT